MQSHLRVHHRLQLWRRREQTRYPGLFLDSISPSAGPAPVVSLHSLRSGRARLLINGVPVLLCGACSALLPAGDGDRAASSASTLPPQNPTEDAWVSCTVCAFPTPLGHLRRLLHLPDDRGPCFPLDVARALLVEAVGAPQSVTLRDPALRAWVRDRDCRAAGLDALCIVLGICDEQLIDGANDDQPTPFDIHGVCLAEQFINTSMPEHVMPRIPFSVTQLCQHIANTEATARRAARARDATNRAQSLVTEALRVWGGQQPNPLTDTQLAALVLKLRALGREYEVEQTKVRRYNHSELHVPKTIQATQSERPISNRSKENPGQAIVA